jgi:hypothetical protein
MSPRSRSRTTPNEGNGSQRFRVAHPYHPLFEQEFEALAWRRGPPQDRVFFRDLAGREASIPVAFTTLAALDPWVVLAAGRSHFRAIDLLELVDLVQRLRS